MDSAGLNLTDCKLMDWILKDWNLTDCKMAVVTLVQKICLNDAIKNDDQVRNTVHCLGRPTLPLLPPEAIPDAVVEIQDEMDSDSTNITNLRKLITYIQSCKFSYPIYVCRLLI